MSQSLANPFVRLFSRWQSSLSKRLFWRQHAAEAHASLQALRRELPTIEMLMAVPMAFRGKGYYHSMQLKQNMGELLGLVNRLREQPLKNICEIGTFKGGTLFIWCQLATPDAHIYSIDLPGGEFGGGYHQGSLLVFQAFCRDNQKLQCFQGDSHEASICSQLRHQLGEAQLDFLFLDGDHSYEGVKKDFELYSPLVRAGGMIGFHDIVLSPDHPDIQVYRFWNEIKGGYRHEEFVDNSGARRSIGIGLLYKT
jgi:predicted O-methyltransferase YrrM